MNIIDLSVLIDNVPRLCNLFLYGFIFMTIYTWLTNKKLDMYLYILWGLFVNFIIVNFYKAAHTFIFDDCVFPAKFPASYLYCFNIRNADPFK